MTGKQNQEIRWGNRGRVGGIQIRCYSFFHTDTSSHRRPEPPLWGEGSPCLFSIIGISIFTAEFYGLALSDAAAQGQCISQCLTYITAD